MRIIWGKPCDIGHDDQPPALAVDTTEPRIRHNSDPVIDRDVSTISGTWQELATFYEEFTRENSAVLSING